MIMLLVVIAIGLIIYYVDIVGIAGGDRMIQKQEKTEDHDDQAKGQRIEERCNDFFQKKHKKYRQPFLSPMAVETVSLISANVIFR